MWSKTPLRPPYSERRRRGRTGSYGQGSAKEKQVTNAQLEQLSGSQEDERDENEGEGGEVTRGERRDHRLRDEHEQI